MIFSVSRTIFIVSLFLISSCRANILQSESKSVNYPGNSLASGGCPEQPKVALNPQSIEAISFKNNRSTLSGIAKENKTIGYIFKGNSGQKFNYQTKEDICVWVYTPDNQLLSSKNLSVDGNYIIQVSAPQGSTTFELKIGLETEKVESQPEPKKQSDRTITITTLNDRADTKLTQQFPSGKFSDDSWLISLWQKNGTYYYQGTELRTGNSLSLRGAKSSIDRQRHTYTWQNGDYSYQINWQPNNPDYIRLQVFAPNGKQLLNRLLEKSSSQIANNSTHQPTSVASAWEAHAHICPESARLPHGTFGSTKNFDITLCRSIRKDSFYIGKERATGRGITVRSTNGRFINGAYEYRLAQNRSGQCLLQVLHKNQIILSESFEEYMFMTNPCDFYMYQLPK
ncbi:MAG: hypothetical protein QNJ32_02270 [Xenococcaceae cyanobacterium MO_167.B27]|nr:hypothetical protein [Xenococcaceae cyanobacterium MO_167.B27]